MFEGVSVGLDEIFKLDDLGMELRYFSGVVGFSLFDCFKQCLSDALQSVGVEIGATTVDVANYSYYESTSLMQNSVIKPS